jgi:hypothetical protein
MYNLKGKERNFGALDENSSTWKTAERNERRRCVLF